MKIKPFELDPRLSWQQAIQTVSFDLLDEASEVLDQQPEGQQEAIHEFRKAMKKTRGLLRLARPALDDEYAQANRQLRDAARLFSEVRDATAIREAVEELAHSLDESSLEYGGAAEVLLDVLREREAELLSRSLDDSIEDALSMVEAVRLRIPEWRVQSGQQLIDGMSKTYGRGRKRFEQAQAGDSKHLHDWRKRAKYHRYHLRLLRPAFRPVMNAERKLAKELSDVLGDEHDLQVAFELLPSIPSGRLSPEQRVALEKVIANRRLERTRRALTSGARLYIESPSQRARRLGAYLGQTRHEQQPPPGQRASLAS